MPVAFQGLSIFRAERNHIPVWKRFFSFPLLMSLLLLWRGSECCMTWLEKPTVTHFCPANRPPCNLFISMGLLNVVRVHGLFLCPTCRGIYKFCGDVNNSFLIIVKRRKCIVTHVNRGRKKTCFLNHQALFILLGTVSWKCPSLCCNICF